MDQSLMPWEVRQPEAARENRARPRPDPAEGRAALRDDIWGRLPRRDDAPRRRALGLIGRAAFASGDHPPAESAAAFRDLLAVPARMTPLSAPFRAHAVVYSLGDLRISLFDGVPHRFERSAAKIAFDDADQIAVQHVVSGQASGSFDGVVASAGEGSVYGIDMARPATIEERGPMRSILVGIRRPMALATLPGAERLHGLSMDRDAADPYLRALYDLVPALEALPAADAPRRAAELLGALSLCLAPCLAQGPDGAAPDDRWAEKRRSVLAFIDRHLPDRRLSPDFIAASLRMSRSTLFAAFRDGGGVERAIVDLRLERARAVLIQPGPAPSVARLADSCGFSSPEHLARVFRQRFGTPPSRFRAATTAATAVTADELPRRGDASGSPQDR